MKNAFLSTFGVASFSRPIVWVPRIHMTSSHPIVLEHGCWHHSQSDQIFFRPMMGDCLQGCFLIAEVCSPHFWANFSTVKVVH
jgi:hypothetical protein